MFETRDFIRLRLFDKEEKEKREENKEVDVKKGSKELEEEC